MARKKDAQEVRAQVEQLVADGKLGETYDLLVSEGWVPNGSGHQVHYPWTLELYAEVDDFRQILKSPNGRLWAWQFPPIRDTSKYYAYWATHDKAYNEAKLELFLERSPNQVYDLIHALPPGHGTRKGKNVMLIHPCLGAVGKNHIYELYENQLEWVARRWAELCGWDPLMVDANDHSPLLIGGGEWGTYLITQKGKIIDLGRVERYND